MKKKNILAISFIVIVAVIITAFIIYRTNYLKNTDEWKINKGYELYGSEKCMNYNDMEHTLGLCVLTPYKCTICGESYTHGSSPAPVICESCAEITGRCQHDGKLLNN